MKIFRDETLETWTKDILPSDRIMIVGASGWFGKTALALCDSLSNPLLLVGSYSRTLEVEGTGRSYEIDIWDDNKIKIFEPTIVIDAAYLTRNFVDSFEISSYISSNQDLVDRSIWVTKLESVRKFIGFSSGAAILARQKKFTVQEDPYGASKVFFEDTFSVLAEKYPEKSILIIRPWSVSGFFVRNPDGYAFSSFILQSFTERIALSSPNPTFRRYCSVEDLFAVGSAMTSKPGLQVLDSGGEKLELGELALKISLFNNSQTRIYRDWNPSAEISDYSSDDSSWQLSLETTNYLPSNVDQQIEQVSNWAKKYWQKY